MQVHAAGKTSYWDVLRLPQARRAFIPTVWGKLSLSMASLALLLLVQTETGDFALSGAVAAGFGIGNVVAAPFRARCVDYWGPRKVLPWLAAGYAVGLTAVVAAVMFSVPELMTVVLGGLAGVFPPPLGAVMRGVWTRVSPTEGVRVRAYSLDAVVEELIFIGGPLVVGALVLLPSGPMIAVVASAGIGLLGTLGLASAPLPEPDRTVQRASGWRGWAGVLRHARMWPVLLTLVSVGIVLGAVEVLSTAYAHHAGNAALAGALVASTAFGSAVGGLLYGTRAWRSRKLTRLLFLAMGACTCLAAAAWLGNLMALLAVFAVAGLFIAPAMVTGYLASDEAVVPAERTEASTLINTAVNLSAAAALGLGGMWMAGATVTGAAYLLAGTAVMCIVAGSAIAALTHRHPA